MADVDALPGAVNLRVDGTPTGTCLMLVTFVSGTRECLQQDWLNPVRVESRASGAEWGIALVQIIAFCVLFSPSVACNAMGGHDSLVSLPASTPAWKILD